MAAPGDRAPCERATEAWESFISAFVDFAVGGHVLPPPRSQPAGATSGPDSPNAGPYDSQENPRRIVAVGDVHGDIEKTREALKLAGLIDSRDCWSGGDTVLVQVSPHPARGFEPQPHDPMQVIVIHITVMSGKHPSPSSRPIGA